jgi:uncharacterized membrane protein YkvA (DUF1232 family)
MIQQARQWACVVKRDVHAIYLAARDPRVPWYAKALAFCVAGYAVSPLDLIPDFVPVLGYLDDVIVVPLGILAVVKLIPPEVIAEHRGAGSSSARSPRQLHRRHRDRYRYRIGNLRRARRVALLSLCRKLKFWLHPRSARK